MQTKVKNPAGINPEWWNVRSRWKLFGVCRNGETLPLQVKKGGVVGVFIGTAMEANKYAQMIVENRNLKSWFLLEVN